jgi:hypothetical protein
MYLYWNCMFDFMLVCSEARLYVVSKTCSYYISCIQFQLTCYLISSESCVGGGDACYRRRWFTSFLGGRPRSRK